MDVHITIADLPEKVDAVAESNSAAAIYIVVRRGLSQIVTACAVADLIASAVDNAGAIPN